MLLREKLRIVPEFDIGHQKPGIEVESSDGYYVLKVFEAKEGHRFVGTLFIFSNGETKLDLWPG